MKRSYVVSRRSDSPFAGRKAGRGGRPPQLLGGRRGGGHLFWPFSPKNLHNNCVGRTRGDRRRMAAMGRRNALISRLIGAARGGRGGHQQGGSPPHPAAAGNGASSSTTPPPSPSPSSSRRPPPPPLPCFPLERHHAPSGADRPRQRPSTAEWSGGCSHAGRRAWPCDKEKAT